VFDLTILAVAAAYVLFLFVLAKLGEGSTDGILDFFRAETLPPRAPRIQEPDLQPFSFGRR
jgi:hypothetical protein